MIIVEPRADTKDDRPAASTSRAVEDVQSVEEGRQSPVEEQPPPYVANEERPLLGSPKAFKYRARRRFVRALVVAYLILMALGVMVTLLGRLAKPRHRGPDWRLPPPYPPPPPRRWPGHGPPPRRRPPPPNAKVIQCLNASDWSESMLGNITVVTSKIHLPSQIESLSMFSHSPSEGSVSLQPIPDDSSDPAAILLLADPLPTDITNFLHICLLERQGQPGHLEFRISHPRGRGRRPHTLNIVPELSVRVRVPQSTRMEALDADMPNFGFSFGNLKSKVFFDRVSIHASKHLIVMDGLYANNISIQTSGASIMGAFHTSNLTLETSQEQMQVDVHLTNDGGAWRSGLNLLNYGGSIQGNLALTDSTHNVSPNDSFDITAVSEGSSVGLKFLQLPQNASVRTEVQAHQAMVSVPPEYEGNYNVTGQKPYVYWSVGKDPSGKNRLKNVTVSNSTSPAGKMLTGQLWWMHDPSVDDVPPALKNTMNITGSRSAVLHLS